MPEGSDIVSNTLY